MPNTMSAALDVLAERDEAGSSAKVVRRLVAEYILTNKEYLANQGIEIDEADLFIEWGGNRHKPKD